MEIFWMHLWSISVQAVIIFCVLLLIRALFSICRVQKKYAYALWAILFVRMLIPGQLQSPLGLMPEGSSIAEAVFLRGRVVQEAGAGTSGEAVHNASLPIDAVSQGGEKGNPGEKAGAEVPFSGESRAEDGRQGIFTNPARQLKLGILSVVWAAGFTGLLLYSAVSYIRLRRKVQCSIRLKENIYLADEISTPFVMGLISPKIYLPSNIREENMPYVIIHEQIHIRRRDYLIKTAAFLEVCLYWFHPVAWLGFSFMCRDMEMSCDEAVLRRLGQESRGDYAESLLQQSCRTGRLAGAPIAFGEGNTESRIRNIMKYKKPLAASAVAGVAVLVIAAAVLLTGPEKNPDMENPEGSGTMVPLDSPLGESGIILDYADEDIIVFHGSFGLYVYSRTENRLIRSVTAVDDFTEEYEKYAEKGGVDTGQFGITEECFWCRNELGMGIQSQHYAFFEEDDAKIYCFLESVDGTVGSLVYTERRYNSDGSSENKCVRHFGGESSGSSIATYDHSTKVTIDGAAYDIAERNFMINAITGIQFADGFWIVEGHINPNVGSYSLYDTQSNSWETDIFGSCLIWENPEGAALGDSIRQTAIYALHNEIFNYKGDVLARVRLEGGEYIKGLIRDGDTVLIQVETITGECVEFMFSYSEALKGTVSPRKVI